MGTVGFVYLAVTGSFSDFEIQCAFEREEDAEAYAAEANRIAMRQAHDSYHDTGEPPEKCWKCQRLIPGWHYAIRIERVQWFSAGVVPIKGYRPETVETYRREIEV